MHHKIKDMKTRLLILAFLACLTGVPAFAQFRNSDEDENPPSKTQYTSIIDLLRREPGIQVGAAGTGEMPRILVRGIGTNSSETQPLIVVDGVFTENITYLHPEDVYNIEVIKDGTAAMYGMRGANGVIEITTKAKHEEDLRTAQASREAKTLERKAKQEAKMLQREAKKAEKAAKKAEKEARKAAEKAMKAK